MSDNIVVITGGFDPIHSGHIEYINEASKLGRVFIGLNSDEWLTKKKGAPFMPFKERFAVLSNLKQVMCVVPIDDSDGTAKDAIVQAKKYFPHQHIVFANGGDRTKDNIPEMVFDDVEFVFGVGGEDKKNSSSWLLQEWKAPKTERPWGYYRVLHDVNGLKVKELTVEPGKSLSMQKHSKRKEYWVVSEGKCKVETEYSSQWLHKHETMFINVEHWHQLSNPFDEPCRIVEIQYGEQCIEEDILRKNI